MDARVAITVSSGYRLSTSRTYNSAQNAYLQFCGTHGITPLPATEQTLLRFILFKTPNVSCQLLHIFVYLAAIRASHILQGFDCPPVNSPRVKLALKGIQAHAPPPKTKTPLTFNILVDIIKILPCDHDTLATWACITLAFFACLRAGELTPSEASFTPRVSDVTFGVDSTGRQYMKVSIRRTKTTPNGIQVVVG